MYDVLQFFIWFPIKPDLLQDLLTRRNLLIKDIYMYMSTLKGSSVMASFFIYLVLLADMQ